MFALGWIKWIVIGLKLSLQNVDYLLVLLVMLSMIRKVESNVCKHLSIEYAGDRPIETSCDVKLLCFQAFKMEINMMF